MRTLGDHSWLNDWVGIPYKFGGRGPEYDCYGLLMAIYREEFGIMLPDWLDIHTMDLKNNADHIEAVLDSGTWTEEETPDDGSFVVCYRTRMAHHLGLHFAGGVIHSVEGMGSVYEPLTRFARTYGRIKFGEWRP